MGKPTGFIEIHRKKQPVRPVAERISLPEFRYTVDLRLAEKAKGVQG